MFLKKSFLSQNRVPLICLTVLLYLFCYRIWNFGITNHDDAEWIVSSQEGHWRVIVEWATSQGRIWAFISGAILYFVLKLENLIIGNVLRIGSFALFFIFFYYIISLYFGRKAAIFSAVLNLALFALRWEGSLITSYPGFAWILGTIFLFSIWASRHYSKNNHISFYILSLLALFISLFIHEGVTILFCSLFFLSVIGNRTPHNKKLIRQLLIGSFSVICFYFLLYIGWRTIFSSHYDGNVIAPFRFSRFYPVLLSFATSGSLLYDIYHPYVVNYNDPIGGLDSVKYSLNSFFTGLSHSPLALIFAVINFYILIYCFRMESSENNTIGYNSIRNNFWMIFIGVAVAFVPLIPVALTPKYQQYFDLGIRSYVYTCFSHFGISLILAAILGFIINQLRNSGILNNLGIILISGIIAFISFGGYRMNDSIAMDMKSEAGRWQRLDHAINSFKTLNSSNKVFFIPKLTNQTWFTVLDESYWSKYMRARFNLDVRIKEHTLTFEDLRAGTVFVDFYNIGDSRSKIIFSWIPLKINKDHEVFAEEIALTTQGIDESDLRHLVLSFYDIRHKQKLFRLNNLEANGDIRILKNIEANPTSIHVTQYIEERDIPLVVSAVP